MEAKNLDVNGSTLSVGDVNLTSAKESNCTLSIMGIKPISDTNISTKLITLVSSNQGSKRAMAPVV